MKLGRAAIYGLLMLATLSALVVAPAWAQTAPPQMAPGTTNAPPVSERSSNLVLKLDAPSYTDINCAGFIGGHSLPTTNYVTGGWGSPSATRFGQRDSIYVAGPDLQPDTNYTVLREIRDPNPYELFRGQRRAVAELGNVYAEMARIHVTGHANKMSIATVQFSCDTIVPGDIVVPYIQHEALPFRPSVPFDRYAPPNGKTQGRIVMAKDFDLVVGTGHKVYLNVGADKGVQAGDYFRVVRNATQLDEVDALSNKATITEDTQKHPPSTHGGGMSIEPAGFPRRALGEMVVMNVQAKSATAMVTYSLEEMQVGDTVEMEEPYAAPPPPPPPPAPRPPLISCAATNTTVHAGDSVAINCAVSSPDQRPVNVAFATDRGRVTPNGINAMLDTRNLTPGPITVGATVTDDRNLSGSTSVGVNVEGMAAPPGASKVADIQFKPNGAYVDNKAKAILDEVALRLQRDADSKAAVVGFGKLSTPAGQRIATARANNVKTYLSKEKGIDAQRISTSTKEGGDTAEVWIVPAGAQMPQ